ncbi:MAG: transporter associated domain-containing protein [Chloroflexota bacterium]
MAGFVMARLNRVPHIGDRFTYTNLRYEVVDIDGARIDRVLVEEVEPEIGD